MARVLLIDDDDDLRAVLSIFLKRSGFKVEEAANGTDGLHLFFASRPNIVVTDIVMPGVDGFELLRVFRSVGFEKAIFMSGAGIMGGTSYVRSIQLMGAPHVLQKPFGPRELLSAIEEILFTPGNVAI